VKSLKSHILIRTVLFAGIVVLVNVISIRVFGRIDLTAQGVYTLAQASKDLVGSLDDRVTVKAYFTEDLPAPYNSNRRATLDILNEYKAYSNGTLHFEFISPTGETGEQEAQQEGIAPVQVQVINDDRLEVKRGYMGLVMLYEDRKETIPVVQNLRSLEYDISSALKRLTTRTKKKIGYATGHREAEPSAFQQAAQMVSSQYELVQVDLKANPTVPGDLAGLLVIGPEDRFSDSSKAALDRYIMHGGKIAFFINRFSATLQDRFARAVDPGLDDLLSHYGVRVHTDLVRDAQCAPVTVMQQQGMFRFQSQIPFPLLPVASNFNREHAVSKDLESVLFFFVSSVDTNGIASRNLKGDVLVRSSERSDRQSGFILIDPLQRPAGSDLAERHIPLAVSVEGSFSSFRGDSVTASLPSSPLTRILVVGDADFMKDDYLGSRGNVIFFANIVDYIADDAGLITIRSKNLVQPPLEQVSDGTKRLLKYVNIFLPPFLVAGYGVFRWRRRATLKRALERSG
jgi:gliding-associated putative ABC transporter substrate-binding component GldG